MKAINEVIILLFLTFLLIASSLILIAGPENIIRNLDDHKVDIEEYNDIETVRIIGLQQKQEDIYYNISDLKHIAPHSDIADHHFAFTT